MACLWHTLCCINTEGFNLKTMIFAATAMALALSANAYAADAVYYQDPAPVAHSAPYDWSGFYVGVNAGIGGGNAKHPFNIADPAGVSVLNGSLNVTGAGFIGGAQVGYNIQNGGFVWGVEGDIQYAHVDHRVSAAFAVPGVGGLDVNAGTRLDWFGTIRARVGAPVTDRFLAYATGGVAYGQTTSSINASSGGVTAFEASSRNTKWGWTIGAGGEYAVTDNMSLKTEYLYTDLGKANVINANIGGGTATLDRDYRFHTVRVGLNFKF